MPAATLPGVQSVERAFAILRCLAGGPAGVSEVAERVGLPKSTVSRLLSTLQVLGAVEQAQGANEYRVGDTMIDIAAAALPGRSLIAIARPHLAELVAVLGETAGLSVLDEREIVYLDQVSADHDVQVRDWTGERIAAHMTSSGLVLLAFAPTAARERYLTGRLDAATPGTT
ncbi:MAG: IclR family transcriptional regulator, partial [Acidimicrobiia bacterium]|nr:IclR family transcriptional regulator [Acidimicrobiia bacterium]